MNKTKFKRAQKELKKYNSDISREVLNLLFILAASPESEEEAKEVCNTYLPNKVDMLGAEKRRNIRVLDSFYEEIVNFIDQMMMSFDDIENDDDTYDGLSEIMEELITLLKDYNTLSKRDFLELSLNTAIAAMDALENKFDGMISELSGDSYEMRWLFGFNDHLKKEFKFQKNNLSDDEPTEKDYQATLEKFCTFLVNAIVMANILTAMAKDELELGDDEDDFEDDEDGFVLGRDEEYDEDDEDEFEFDFENDDEPVFDPDDKRAFELKFKLMHTSPAVSRTLHVPAGYNLGDLHHIIQDIFEWDDMHLHEFIKNKQRYNPRPDSFHGDIASTQVLLSEIFKRKGSKIKYMYDFGDSWLLEISLLKTHKNMEKTYPVCIDAYGTSPREDSGGMMVYLDMVDEGKLRKNDYNMKKVNRILKGAYKNAFE
ncbi:plasmid pRiA4b ORF-3 family protein [Flexistipes sinusarabici DSM 4947]|uniref:Plasmid pRiA4b ORF-3 family protein n=1 Tax=Flexistipes sinusarabici (strain ATCC 49648 / DSM 4947 / MAS 10) TaxID=717231 RepID=F8E4F3_FLESM|nr:plasmid pRiA4b ORF-3 family protein [Flexistipes sinusarabici]AEI14439.1 plasmid pRiA4b ORF-3 family protein [Flexistipes sinusarabici DSM 4947]